MKYKKYIKALIKLVIFAGLLLLVYGAWSTHRQETSNTPIFWDADRTVNGLGMLVAFIGWGFWEFYSSSTTKKLWVPITGLVLVLVGTIMINGVLGTAAGFTALAAMSVAFALDYTKVFPIRKEAA